MGRYDPKAIFDKEPAVIAGAVRSVLWVGVLLGLITIGEQALAGVALVLELVLTLFVRQQSTSVASPSLQLGTLVSNPDKPGGDEPPPDLVVARVDDVVMRPVAPRPAQG